MLTIHNNSYRYDGLSSETKPTDVPNGTIFHEIDTGDDYQFNADSGAYVKQPSSGGGGGGGDTGSGEQTFVFPYNSDIATNPAFLMSMFQGTASMSEITEEKAVLCSVDLVNDELVQVKDIEETLYSNQGDEFPYFINKALYPQIPLVILDGDNNPLIDTISTMNTIEVTYSSCITFENNDGDIDFYINIHDIDTDTVYDGTGTVSDGAINWNTKPPFASNTKIVAVLPSSVINLNSSPMHIVTSIQDNMFDALQVLGYGYNESGYGGLRVDFDMDIQYPEENPAYTIPTNTVLEVVKVDYSYDSDYGEGTFGFFCNCIVDSDGNVTTGYFVVQGNSDDGVTNSIIIAGGSSDSKFMQIIASELEEMSVQERTEFFSSIEDAVSNGCSLIFIDDVGLEYSAGQNLPIGQYSDCTFNSEQVGFGKFYMESGSAYYGSILLTSEGGLYPGRTGIPFTPPEIGE